MPHVGVDLHKRFSQVAILGEDGSVTQRRIEHQGTEMEKFLDELEAGTRIAVEATGRGEIRRSCFLIPNRPNSSLTHA